jgi:uncharacterized NAD-dependent epimerase/dehydratase family protein
MNRMKLTPDNRLALMMHDATDKPFGKMGFGLMRYGVAPTVVVIDRVNAGKSLHEITGIPCQAPIVATVQDALRYQPDVLIPAIAPGGGMLPQDWLPEIREGLAAGMSLVNGLHRPLANDPDWSKLLHPGRYIWDIRQEPPGLENGMGRAAAVSALRVLLVGTDMANGKMTAALELDRAAKARGLRSRFLATGQIGIAIAGEGIPLDAVRVDYATGAVEQMVVKHGDNDILFIEGQGSLLHPASTAPLALMRGSVPTHMVLVHRAGQKTLLRCAHISIPPLTEVIALYEAICSACGSLPSARIVGIALNGGRLSDEEIQREREKTQEETGLPVTDVLRFGCDPLLNAILEGFNSINRH